MGGEKKKLKEVVIQCLDPLKAGDSSDSVLYIIGVCSRDVSLSTRYHAIDYNEPPHSRPMKVNA
jgi:hypothetical protein